MIQLWDTAGQERYRTIITSYYRGSQAILIVYDITNRVSFDNVTEWLNEIAKHASDDVLKILVGSKSDLDENRSVSYEEGQKFADSHGMPFYEISSKMNTNIDEIFENATTQLLSNSLKISHIRTD
eukprot:TRINITY_DN1745_c0_g1_i1.p1 TRINITY_DN1745_c0_g1~~TRINITY_DN1745_c0_g1_i1.p1  ORF type:complete len:126 (-),score=14.32 TRINITY_DN1745_c0_g1_i1:115-492(-)